MQRKHVPPLPSNDSHETVDHTVKEGPSLKQHMKVSDKPAQLTRASRSNDKLIQKKNRTNHVSVPLRIPLGKANLMLYGSSGQPLPPPSLAGSGQLRRQIHVARWQTTRHHPRCFHSSCLPARLPTLHFRPSTLGPENHPRCRSWRPRCLAQRSASSASKEEKLAMLPDAGPQPTQLPEDHWFLFSRRKKKSSPYGPYLPGTFHCLEVVRRSTLSQASRKGHRTSSHNGSIRSDTTRSHAIAALLPQSFEQASVPCRPKNISELIPRARKIEFESCK